jgi:hypothetical protein
MSIRTQERADAIVEGLTNGIPLRELCRTEGISKSEVYRWQDDDADFKGRIVRAREAGFEHIFEECLEIADDATNDWMEKRSQDGETMGAALNGEHVQRSKLRIETRLKLLSKWDPKRYGDKVQTELTGAGGGPVSVLINFAPPPSDG